MGGYGSGRGQWSKPSTASKLRLDVRRLVRELGATLKAGKSWRGVWSWGESRAGVQALLVPATAKGVLVLSYKWNGTDHEQQIRLEGTACNYGGLRWWARCPACPRRVAVLWGPSWRCRECHGLAYGMSQLSKRERAATTARRAFAKLGCEDWDGWGVLPDEREKPKWMRWRTFHRLVGEIEQAQAAELAALPKCLREMIALHGYG